MTDDTDIDGLAGEYVLGALPPGERSAVIARIATDPRLATAVADWERRLSPLSWQAPGIDPSSQVLGGILATIGRDRDAAPQTAEIVTLRRRVRAWQWAASGMAATLAAVAIGIGYVGPNLFGPGPTAEVAVLASVPGSATADEPAGGIIVAFVATHDRNLGRLAIRQVAGRPAVNGRVFVAWLEPSAGAPAKLLGVLRRDDTLTNLDLAMAPGDYDASRLIVSLEHDRAAAMDRPRGPIVSAGRPGRP